MIDIVPLPSEIALLDEGENNAARLARRRGWPRPVRLAIILLPMMIGVGGIAASLRSTAGNAPAATATALD